MWVSRHRENHRDRSGLGTEVAWGGRVRHSKLSGLKISVKS